MLLRTRQTLKKKEKKKTSLALSEEFWGLICEIDLGLIVCRPQRFAINFDVLLLARQCFGQALSGVVEETILVFFFFSFCFVSLFRRGHVNAARHQNCKFFDDR